LNVEHTPPSADFPLSCQAARREIDLLVEDGGLNESERMLLFGHIRQCAACKADLEVRRTLELRLRKAFSQIDTAPDFTDRVLETLPARGQSKESSERDQDAWTVAHALVRLRSDERMGPLAWLVRGYRLPVALAAVILLALTAVYVTQGITPEGSDAPPMVADLEGAVAERVHAGKATPLKTGDRLAKDDVVRVGLHATRPLRMTLTSGNAELAVVHLRPGAVLKVTNRHEYFLIKGEAYFEVNKNRPQVPGERYSVETSLGLVEVTGTSFGVVVPSENPGHVTVAVDEGRVEIIPNSGSRAVLLAGEEGALVSSGGFNGPRAPQSGLLAWAPRPRVLANQIPSALAPNGISQRPTPPAGQGTLTPLAPRVQGRKWWKATLELECDFTGKTLPEALRLLSRTIGGEPELDALAAHAERTAKTKTSRLRLPYSIPLAAVVRWLHREQGMVFPPQGWEGPAELSQFDRSGRFSIAANQAWERVPTDAHGARYPLAYRSEAAELNVFCEKKEDETRLNLRVDNRLPDDWDLAWYDGLIFIAEARRIEELTCCERTVNLEEWTGTPVQAVWQRGLLSVLTAKALDWGLDPALLKLRPARNLVYTSGVGVERKLLGFLEKLRLPSSTVHSPLAPLDEHSVSARSFKELAAEAAKRNIRVKIPDDAEFPAQSFSARAMPLGHALEWAARLHGLGVRSEAGQLVMDQPETCFGAPEWQVLGLDALAALAPEARRELPRLAEQHVRAWFPELFKCVDFHLLQDRLVFNGNRRLLAAAQRVLHALQQEVRKTPTLDMARWQPAWRMELDKNLAEPCRTETSAAGLFAYALRSGVLINLRASLLVDPAAMKRAASLKIPALDLRGKSLREVLADLAQTADLRVVIEDRVICLCAAEPRP